MKNSIIAILQAVKITDILDMAIITIFIYMILVWLKKSRARFMLMGMIVMVLIYVIARLFGLYVTTMALQAFFAVAIIMVVVIFQDDFRHFFENIAVIGTARRHRLMAPYSQVKEILTSVLANLSREKIGALVVVKGRDMLDRHLEAGINLDGLLSQILLESIFDRHVPSHDGAVIVEGSLLTKFGCYLPLSTNIKEVGRLGTRHAAGLGLTERTDALCLIVSEEEGTISVAEAGRLRHLKDIAQLDNILENFYNTKFPKKKAALLTNFATKNLFEKTLAIILACSLWFLFGHRTETVRRDFVVPIEYRNLAPNVIIKEPKVKDVVVTLNGSEQEFNLLKPKELKVSLDASDIKDGNNTLLIPKDLIKSPAGFSVVNVEPAKIKVNTYRIINLNVPVRCKTKGQLPAGIILKEIKAEPKEVAVIAPSTIPKDSIFVDTEQIDLKSVTDNTTVIPKFIIPPDVHFPDDRPPDVKVTVQVEKTKK